MLGILFAASVVISSSAPSVVTSGAGDTILQVYGKGFTEDLSGPASAEVAVGGEGQWDLTSDSGQPVTDGSYVYLITNGKKTIEGKLKVYR